MKKALTLVILIVTPSIIFAQGSVAFLNNSASLVQQWTSAYDSTLAPVPVGGGYVQLIVAPRGNPLLHPLGVYEGSSGFLPGYSSLAGFLADNPGWAVFYPDHGTPAPIILAPGRFNGGSGVIYSIGNGADADYVVIGWTGAYATYDDAYAADLANPNSSFLGMSAIATTHTGITFINPGTAVPLSSTFQGMTLAPAVIPEPTTVLLAGLGAVLLLLFRRLISSV
jgi:PEP-CTERM motif